MTGPLETELRWPDGPIWRAGRDYHRWEAAKRDELIRRLDGETWFNQEPGLAPLKMRNWVDLGWIELEETYTDGYSRFRLTPEFAEGSR